MLHIPTIISGPTLCVTYFHCYQPSNTVCYTFPLFLTVISRPTLCVTYFHCYQWSNTLCYIFPLLSAVQHCVLQVSTVISGPTLCGHPVAIRRSLRGSGCHEQPRNRRGFARLPAESLQRSQRRHRAPPGDPQRHGQLLSGGHGG